MTPRDREALEDIRSVIDRALGFPIADFEALERTDYLQDALIRCLEVMGEAVKRISPELREQHSDLPWRGMAGMRDLLIHAYDRVDLDEVWQAYRQLPVIREAIVKILTRLTRSDLTQTANSKVSAVVTPASSASTSSQSWMAAQS
jgi:uncharacterized protein with HEPN domain